MVPPIVKTPLARGWLGKSMAPDGSARVPATDRRYAVPGTKADQVARVIRQEISRSRMRPGDKLPTVQEWAERLDVSTLCVREAVGWLRGIGLVNAKPGVGLRVADVNVFHGIEARADVVSDDVGRTWPDQGHVNLWDASGRETFGDGSSANRSRSIYDEGMMAFGKPDAVRVADGSVLVGFWCTSNFVMHVRYVRLKIRSAK